IRRNRLLNGGSGVSAKVGRYPPKRPEISWDVVACAPRAADDTSTRLSRGIVGRRDGTETLANVLLAFLEQRTWRQAELARRVGVERRQLVRVLDNLTRAGFDIHREEEHPDVYWSVPKHWFPGGVAFSGEDVSDLVRVLQLAPQSKKRDRLLSWISACATGVGSNEGHVVTRVLSPAEEASL